MCVRFVILCVLSFESCSICTLTHTISSFFTPLPPFFPLPFRRALVKTSLSKECRDFFDKFTRAADELHAWEKAMGPGRVSA